MQTLTHSYNRAEELDPFTIETVDAVASCAAVPSRTVRAFLRHEVGSTASLFERIHDDESDTQQLRFAPALAKQYKNEFDGHEIELLIAAFHRRQDDSGLAIFRSESEWIQLACGKTARDAPEYYDAIQRLQQPHWVLDVPDGEKDRYVLTREAPVQLALVQDADDDRVTRQLHVRISFNHLQSLKSFHLVPLALSKLLRSGGLRRVETAHIKLYLYLLTRAAAQVPQKVFDLARVLNHTGLGRAGRHRHGQRAVDMIRAGLDAMVQARIILSYSFLSRTQVAIEPNMWHFKPRRRRRTRRATQGDDL